jgi:glutathione synthase/RimK-type ligase-like ATP-grasp enzyme
MLSKLKQLRFLKPLRKTPWYCRFRQHLPMPDRRALDDRDSMREAERVSIDWPDQVRKPRVGVVKDFEPYPRWTKYCRFLENNGFDHSIYNIHAHDWIERAEDYDVIVGICSCEQFDLQEIREKYYFLERHLGKATFPSLDHAMLYEDKRLEYYIAATHGIPFAKTYVSYDREDALALVERLDYPVVSKIVPASGSVGVQLLRTPAQCRRIIRRVFSRNGRKTHCYHFRQKNFVYFQEYLPNDGYDIRATVIGNWVFGYYRRVLAGDFRASGMGRADKRALPMEAMKLARRLNAWIKSPMLVVDMVRALDGRYVVIEYSPVCQVEKPEQLRIDGVPGVYVFTDADTCHFQPGKYWVQELSLREFLLHHYLPWQGEEQAMSSATASVARVLAPA